MISYNDNQTYLSKFIKESFGDVQKNAVRAANYAGILEEDYDDYIIIMIDGYYNIVKVLDEIRRLHGSEVIREEEEQQQQKRIKGAA